MCVLKSFHYFRFASPVELQFKVYAKFKYSLSVAVVGFGKSLDTIRIGQISRLSHTRWHCGITNHTHIKMCY